MENPLHEATEYVHVSKINRFNNTYIHNLYRISPSENPDLSWKCVGGEHGTPVRLIDVLLDHQLMLS